MSGDILQRLELFSLNDESGIGAWFKKADQVVQNRLRRIDMEPLSKVQLNQLLVLSHEGSVSDGFFEYYWLTVPTAHSYDVTSLEGFDGNWLVQKSSTIDSFEQFRWGLYRLYVDGLSFCGNIRTAFRCLRVMTRPELEAFFGSHCHDSAGIKSRGPALPLMKLNRDDRYLISEMACKSYGSTPMTESDLKSALVAALKNHKAKGGTGSVTIKKLLNDSYAKERYADSHDQLVFSADGLLDETVTCDEEIQAKYAPVAAAFIKAREAALQNTKFYLSMINDLDVYVATSMRNRQDFRDMADTCDKIFGDPRLRQLELRYFDPTMSAAEGHEDKGLIECLMVKSAKVLVYCAGDKESYGKDAEAAMALSLGKPVIFFCNHAQKSKFYRDVHPLSRLIEFETGVAVGALVTDRLDDIPELLARIFENRMQYVLEQPRSGYLRLVDRLTKSIVRLQTNDSLLTETFWNRYQNQQRKRKRLIDPRSPAAA